MRRVGRRSRSLGEVVGVVGTPYTLHYQSERTPGGRIMEIDVSGDTVPAHIAEYRVTVRVAGREFVEDFAPEANLTVLFAWDGRDDNGNVALGGQWATVEVAELYVAGGQEQRWNRRQWGGTLGGWDPRAVGLGGWSLSAHHFFDPLDRILYLGSGGERSGAELGVVQEVGDDVYIASEDGLAVYVFDRQSGLHRRTFNALTGADLFTFTYDQGRLTQIDNGGQVTTIGPTTITGPFGDTTTVAVNANGYWESLSVGGFGMSFTYTPFATSFARLTRTEPMADGLLSSVTDPKDVTWQYQFNARGWLGQQADPGDGTITATRGAVTSAPNPAKTVKESYAIDLATAGSDAFRHQVIEYTDGSVDRTVVGGRGDVGAEGAIPPGTHARSGDCRAIMPCPAAQRAEVQEMLPRPLCSPHIDGFGPARYASIEDLANASVRVVR